MERVRSGGKRRTNKTYNRILMLLAVMLTARMGVLHNTETGFTETWYNLPMQKALNYRANEGFAIDYWERADGCKMNGRFIILAADKSIPMGTIIETSRGTGMVLDQHKTDANVIDIAVAW